jgi:integrase
LTLGLRLGELLGLRWQDIDLVNETLRVVQQLEKPGLHPVFGPPKSESSRRAVTMPSTVVAELRRWKVKQNEERLSFGRDYVNRHLVFTQPNGHPISPGSLHRWSFKPLLKKAGLPDMRFHDLRHSAATLLLAIGEHPKVVQERLGHSSITLTMDTYSHVVPSLQREAAAKLDALLSQSTPKSSRDVEDRTRRNTTRARTNP